MAKTVVRPKIVIVGGGFGGLYAAQALAGAKVDITLVDRRNFHVFQPLLYQVATGALSPGEIASPLRYVLNRQRNVRVLLGELSDIDPIAKLALLADGGQLPYDTMIVATGATHHYFGHPEWSEFAPGLKSIEDATEIRTRVLLAFERAEREEDRDTRRALLTFVVVGAGPTGVELAGALAEISRDTLRNDFRSIDPADAKIYLIEGADRVLFQYPPDLSAAAQSSLEMLGVQVLLSARVTMINGEGVGFQTAEGEFRIQARTTLWAAGVQASPFAKTLAARTGAPVDRAGRIRVEPDLTIPGHPEIFVIGDVASMDQGGKPVPGVAPAAMQMGRYAAAAILRRLRNQPAQPFQYWDKGSLATIGRNHAVADLGFIRFSGYFAWLAWVLIHLLYIVLFENRLLIAIKWAWNYITFNRGARLITGDISAKGRAIRTGPVM
jgi:NADH dehydrogenase